MKSRVLLVGGLGYIGVHLVSKLTDVGYSVVVIDNKPIETIRIAKKYFVGKDIQIIKCDCSIYDELFSTINNLPKIDVVVNLLFTIDNKKYSEHNINCRKNDLTSFINLLGILNYKKPTSFIQMSTIWTKRSLLATNNSNYVEAKLFCDNILNGDIQYNYKKIIIRPAILLGVSDDFIDCNIIEPNINSLIGKIYNSSINNEEFVVLRCEDNIVDNTTFRNFICIFDFVTYVSEIIGKHESFNDGVSFDIGERYPISMSEFISIYNSVCEKNAKFTLGEVEKLTRDTLSIHISELLDNGAHKNNSLPFAIKSHYKWLINYTHKYDS